MKSVLLTEARNSRYELIKAEYNPALNRVLYETDTIFDQTDEDERDYFTGDFSSQDWLNAIGNLYLDPSEFSNSIITLGYSMSPYDFAQMAARFLGNNIYSNLFLDSFSIIENGEVSRRLNREIHKSPAQKAILSVYKKHPEIIWKFTPREFEVFVANALVDIGFSRVSLRRYSKDGGIDILAIMANGEIDETVIVEVKHSKNPIGLSFLDRVNGVRDRIEAQRALLVSSSHITRDAKTEYSAKCETISALTINELFAYLKDTPDWFCSPNGLWSKNICQKPNE